MHDSFLRALQTQRPRLRTHWEELLRAERVTSGMAHPDSLVYLMDWTLDQLIGELKQAKFRRHLTGPKLKGERKDCACGKNPLLAYFATVEQAVVELLFLSDGELAHLAAVERSASLEDLKSALHAVARREIESFCAVCQSRERHETMCRNRAKASPNQTARCTRSR